MLMTMLVLDPSEEKRLKAERARTRADRYDEVWDGVYIMAPLAGDEHQALAGILVSILHLIIYWPGLGEVRQGINISDRIRGWRKNYRCPDVAVFLKGAKAKNCGSFWFGGPDWAAEIVSPKDKSRDKLEFYAKVGVRELLIIDRKPWRLELYRLRNSRLPLVGVSTTKKALVLACEVVPLTFSLQPAKPRPKILVTTTDGEQRWAI
jgi:Uma2 family endonuclease